MTELEKLQQLYREDFTPDYEENPYLADFDKILKDVDKNNLKEFVKALRLYKSRFIEQSMQIFPISEAELNYRNGVVIETSKLIRTLETYTQEKPDPVYRDHGELKNKLLQANSGLIV